MGSCVCLLSRKNKSAGVNRVSYLRGDGRSCSSELGEGSGWVVDVTVWVLETVEGRTLVFGQRNTVLDAQWQVGLESKGNQNSVHYRSIEGRNSR